MNIKPPKKQTKTKKPQQKTPYKKQKQNKKPKHPKQLLLTRNNPFIWYKACLPVLVAISTIRQRNKVQRGNLEKQKGKAQGQAHYKNMRKIA